MALSSHNFPLTRHPPQQIQRGGCLVRGLWTRAAISTLVTAFYTRGQMALSSHNLSLTRHPPKQINRGGCLLRGLWTRAVVSGDSWGGRQFSRIHPPQQVWRGGWSFRGEYWPGALENRIDLAICNVRGHLEQQTGGNTYPGFKPPFTMGWGTALSTTKASSYMASANAVETPGGLNHA